MNNKKEKYRMTPKGCAVMAMIQCGLIDSIDDERIVPFLDMFDEIMEQTHEIVFGEEEMS